MFPTPMQWEPFLSKALNLTPASMWFIACRLNSDMEILQLLWKTAFDCKGEQRVFLKNVKRIVVACKKQRFGREEGLCSYVV